MRRPAKRRTEAPAPRRGRRWGLTPTRDWRPRPGVRGARATPRRRTAGPCGPAPTNSRLGANLQARRGRTRRHGRWNVDHGVLSADVVAGPARVDGVRDPLAPDDELVLVAARRQAQEFAPARRAAVPKFHP